MIVDKLVQVLVFGCGYRKIADATCSATTIRDRRHQWIRLGIFAALELLVLDVYDRMVGLELGDLAMTAASPRPPTAAMPPAAVRSTAASKAANARS